MLIYLAFEADVSISQRVAAMLGIHHHSSLGGLFSGLMVGKIGYLNSLWLGFRSRLPFSLAQVQGWLSCFAPRHLALLIREADSPAPFTLLLALALLLWPGAGLTPAELRLYGLHLRRSRAAGGGAGGAAAYIGEAAWAVRCWRLNRGASGLLNDKLKLSYLLAGSHLGAPRTLAYLGVPAPLLPVPALESTFELVGFLRQATYPLFLKGTSKNQEFHSYRSLQKNALRRQRV